MVEPGVREAPGSGFESLYGHVANEEIGSVVQWTGPRPSNAMMKVRFLPLLSFETIGGVVQRTGFRASNATMEVQFLSPPSANN